MNSTRPTKPGKGRKPYPDFPLFPHANGRWAKKIRQRLVYFGKVADDPTGERALALWLDQRDDLLAGRQPRKSGDTTPTIADLCNRFLTAKLAMVENEELAQRSFLDYKRVCGRVVAALGRHRLLSDLRPDDFEKLRKTIARRSGPVTLGNEIQRIRVLFKYAYDADLITAPIKYGSQFKRPSKKTLRLARKAKGARMFEAAELRAILDAANPVMRAMVLLGINAGLGAADIARLRGVNLDLKHGWLDYPRPKTGIDRRVPLWAETIAALEEATAQRPTPRDAADDDLVFLTKYGNPWCRMAPDTDGKMGTPLDAIGQSFSKVLIDLGIKRPGLSFYALRHTLETIGGEAKDQVALDAIMGHARDDMASVYRERISDERLRAVVEHIRNWLFGKRRAK